MLVHPVDDIPFVPDERPRTQLDLLREGPFVHAGINEGLTHTSLLKDLRQEDEVWRSTKVNQVGWSFVERPT